MRRGHCLLLLASLAVFGAGFPSALTMAAEGSFSEWSKQRDERLQALNSYLVTHDVGYQWFADFPFGSSDGIPYLVLKLLPKLAPEEWGDCDNFLDAVGLFRDERLPHYPIARGVGWSGMARDESRTTVDYASFTCGACHIGRVRDRDGSWYYLDGGVNTQFDLVRYRTKVVRTIAKIVDGGKTSTERIDRATARITAALNEVHAEDPEYFYQNCTIAGRTFDAAYEAEQVRLFKNDSREIVARFLLRADLELRSLVALVEKNYQGFEQPMLRGFGGMADATGVSTSFGYLHRKEIEKDPKSDPNVDLPPTAGLTDFMAVWRQSERKARWSSDGSRLIDGGGQWNGNIPIPIYRNLAAQLTMGFAADTDVRVAALAVDFLDGLPSSPYPFDVDMELARRGQVLFQRHCADCHRPNNGTVYSEIGTDMGRAQVVSESIAQRARQGFTTIGSPQREVTLPPGKSKTNPFSTYEGVMLEGKSRVVMGDPKEHLGYVALPLSGVWATAPYFHNGSVPTLFHLLIPSERPSVFAKGRLGFDSTMVGYSWKLDPDDQTEPGEYQFDTSAHSSVSRSGHDRDITENGKTYKLDWSDDRRGALALIEYLKSK